MKFYFSFMKIAAVVTAKSFDRVRERLNWPWMRQDVREWVSS